MLPASSRSQLNTSDVAHVHNCPSFDVSRLGHACHLTTRQHVTQTRTHRRADPLKCRQQAHAAPAPACITSPQYDKPSYINASEHTGIADAWPATTAQDAACVTPARHTLSTPAPPLILEQLPDWEALWRCNLLRLVDKATVQVPQAVLILERITSPHLLHKQAALRDSLHLPELQTVGHPAPLSSIDWQDVADRLASLERVSHHTGALGSLVTNCLSVEELCSCACALRTIMTAASHRQQQPQGPELHVELDRNGASMAAQQPCPEQTQPAPHVGSVCNRLVQWLWTAVPATVQALEAGGFESLLLLAHLALLPTKPVDNRQLNTLLQALQHQLLPPAPAAHNHHHQQHQLCALQLSIMQLQQLICSMTLLGPVSQAHKSYLLTAWQQHMLGDSVDLSSSSRAGSNQATAYQHSTSCPMPSVADQVVMMSALAVGCSASPSREWLCLWAHVVAVGLPHASATTVVQLLQLLAALPKSVTSQLEYEPSFWAAVWQACQVQVLGQQQQQPASGLSLQPRLASAPEASLLMAALRAVGKLQKHGITAPDTWTIAAIGSLTSYTQRLDAEPQLPQAEIKQPDVRQLVGYSINTVSDDINTSDATGNHQYLEPGLLLVRILQAVHHTSVTLSTANAHSLAVLLETWLSRLPRVQLSKVLPMLPRLALQLPRRDAHRLHRAKLQSMGAMLLQLATARGNYQPHLQPSRENRQTNTSQPPHQPFGNDMPDSSRQRQVSFDVAAVPIHSLLTSLGSLRSGPSDQMVPGNSGLSQPADSRRVQDAAPHAEDSDHSQHALEAWELSNWLHALSQVPAQAAAVAGAARGGWQPPQPAVQRLLPLVLAASSPGVLNSATNGDLVSIASALAHMRARPGEEWLVALASAAHARRLQALPPRQLVTLCWAFARLQMGHMLPSAWTARLMTLMHGCMETLPSHSLVQMAWAMAAMQRQRGGSMLQQATAQQQAQAHIDSQQQQQQHESIWPSPEATHAAWLLHLLHATSTLSREASARTLASMAYSVATLMQGLKPLDTAPHAPCNVQHGYHAMLEQLAAWAEGMLQAFARRLHVADAHSVSCMLASMAIVTKLLDTGHYVKPTSSNGAQPPVMAVYLNSNSHDGNAGSNRTADGSMQQHADGGSSLMPSSLASLTCRSIERLHSHAAEQQCSSQDLAVAATAMAALGKHVFIPHEVVHQHVAFAASVTATNTPSQQFARDLSSILLAASHMLKPSPQTQPVLENQLAQVPQALTVCVGDVASGKSGQPMQAGQLVVEQSGQQLAAVVRRLLQQLPQHLPAADAGALAATWLGLGRLGYCPDRETLGVLFLACHRRMHEMNGAQLGHMVWALGRLGLQPGSRWLDRLQLVAFKALQQGSIAWHGQALMAWAAARGRWPLHREFASSLMPGVHALPELRLLDLSMFAWAGARLGLRPSQPWVMLLLLVSGKRIAQLCTGTPVQSPGQGPDSTSSKHPAHDGTLDAVGSVVKQDVTSQPANALDVSQSGVTGQAGVTETEPVAHSISAPPVAGLAAGQLGSAEAGQLLMLAESLEVWGVRAPHWWWSAWTAAMHAAVRVLDLRRCSAVLEQLRLCSSHSGLALPFQWLCDGLISRIVELLHRGSPGQPPHLPSCAVILHVITVMSVRDYKAVRRASFSGSRQAKSSASGNAGQASERLGTGVVSGSAQDMAVGQAQKGEASVEGLEPSVLLYSPLQHPAAAELVEQLFQQTRPYLAAMKPSHLVLLAGAAALLKRYKHAPGFGVAGAISRASPGMAQTQQAAHACGNDAHGREVQACSIVPDAWAEEMARVLEARSAVFNVKEHNGALAALAVLQGHARVNADTIPVKAPDTSGNIPSM